MVLQTRPSSGTTRYSGLHWLYAAVAVNVHGMHGAVAEEKVTSTSMQLGERRV